MIMNRGKDICKEQKTVRRQIAEENGIDLEIPECTYKGPCKGTCPRCESEVRFLENELAKRIKLGKVATVAGLALTLGISGNAAAQTVTGNENRDTVAVSQPQCYARLEGVVKDSITKEVLPFVNIMIMKDGKQVNGGMTDFDGLYSIRMVPGEYQLVVGTYSYFRYEKTVIVPEGKNRVEQPDILLRSNPDHNMEDVLIYGMSVPIFDISPEGTINTEIQNVPLRIQY